MGLETEFCIRRSASSSSSRRPSTREVCRAILDALDSIVDTAPGDRAGWPRYQRFVQNGGAFSFEVTRVDANDGLLESATPECRGASQLLLYERAQEALIRRALPLARRRLASQGCDSDIAIVKNSRDAEGHVYGAQENYEADIARGWRLLVYRLVVAALLPGVLCWMVAIIIATVLALLALLVVCVIFPVARHWVGFGPYSEASSSDDEPWPVRVALRIAAAAAKALVSPISLTFLFALQVIAFRQIRSDAMAFLLSRSVMTGAGTLCRDGSFALSERAESITRCIRTSVRQRSRAVFDTGNLVKLLMLDSGGVVATLSALFSRRQRLQLGIGDSNCAQTAEFLKIGTTALVIDMVEAGCLRDAPRVRRPVRALKRISKDPTLQAQIALKRGGSMTALDIQRWYLRRAEAFLSNQPVASIESREIVTLWRKTLQALERNPVSLVGRIDWVTKRMLMADAGMNDAARKKIDIKYHEIGSGYFSMLERKGIAPVRLSVHDIDDAISRPPTNTPAWRRGQSIRLAGDARVSMSVSFLPGRRRKQHAMLRPNH